MYSCSKSFRELKNAIKTQLFLYLGGLGVKSSFQSKKKHVEEYWYRREKIFGRLAFYTWVPLSNITVFVKLISPTTMEHWSSCRFCQMRVVKSLIRISHNKLIREVLNRKVNLYSLFLVSSP